MGPLRNHSVVVSCCCRLERFVVSFAVRVVVFVAVAVAETSIAQKVCQLMYHAITRRT